MTKPEKTVIAKTVSEYLAEVSYAPNPNYVPSLFALEMLNFIKLIDGGRTENITPDVHLRMLDSFVDASDKDVINLCHRGMAKTSLLEYLIYRIAIYGELPNLGKIPYIIYVSDSIDNGVKKMRKALENRFNQSDFLQQHLAEAKFTDIRWEFIRHDGTSLVVGGYGAKTGVRGTRENNSRPIMALLDDIISDEDARSATVIESIKTTVNSAIEPALHPKRRKIIWNGTPFNANDPIYTSVESGAWLVNVYPICEKFPCSREEFRGSWEDRFDYDFVERQYTKLSSQGAAHSFFQEYMLQILSNDTRLIWDEDIKRYSRRALLKNKSNFNFYITTDFATSDKQHSDFSFISVWAVNNKGFKYWVDGICRKQTMDKNLDDLFRLVQTYQPQSVGIEVTGQQGGFIPWIEQEMMNRNIYFSLASDSNNGRAGIRPTVNKLQRFNVAVPYFKKGEMFFPMDYECEALRELLLELSQTSIGGFKSKHDDGLDTVSMLPLMPIWLPSEEGTPHLSGGTDYWRQYIEEPEHHSISNYLV